jgi:hypothetical protein
LLKADVLVFIGGFPNRQIEIRLRRLMVAAVAYGSDYLFVPFVPHEIVLDWILWE